MIRKRFTSEVMFSNGLSKTVGKFLLAVGATPTAWGRFGGSLVYQGKKPLRLLH